jgi:hypothetical protein
MRKNSMVQKMGYFSQAVQRHYTRTGNRIVFTDGQNLNQLALSMWEALNCSQVDASVLSRVLNGQRLFTLPQLKVFCSLLNLSIQESDHLERSLRQDIDGRLPGGSDSTPRLSRALTQDLISELTDSAFSQFYRGQYEGALKRHELVRQLAGAYTSTSNVDSHLYKRVGYSTYIQGRIVGNGDAKSVLDMTFPIVTELIALSHRAQDASLYGYAHILLANAYYGAGGYSELMSKHKLYKASIRSAQRALEYLPRDDHESLFAVRSIAASAFYLNDSSALEYAYEIAKQRIPYQQEDNYINALHLAATLDKGIVALSQRPPYEASKFTAKYFNATLEGSGAYEISAIKEEIDMLRISKTSNWSYIRQLVVHGLIMANTSGSARYQQYFVKLLKTMR